MKGQTNTNRRGVTVREWPRRADHGADGVPFNETKRTNERRHKHSNNSPSDHSSLPFHKPNLSNFGIIFSTVDVSHVPCPYQPFSTKRTFAGQPGLVTFTAQGKKKAQQQRSNLCPQPLLPPFCPPQMQLLLTHVVNHAV